MYWKIIGRPGCAGLVHALAVMFCCEQRLVGGHRRRRYSSGRPSADLPGAAHRQRLEVLRAHQRAHAGAPGHPPVIRKDAGKRHLVLARLADAGHPGLRLASLLADDLLGLVGIGRAPQVLRRAQLDLLVVDPQVNRLLAPAR